MERTLSRTRCDVVVIGAGAMGSATTWWLARRGVDTVLLERFEQGHGRGSSHGATRIFRLAYQDRRYMRMAAEALPLWRELEDDTGTPLLVTTGGLDHGAPPLVAATIEALAAEGVAHQVLGPGASAERWPGMRFEGDVVVQPDAGRCLADVTVRVLQDRAVALGADVRFSAGDASVALLHDPDGSDGGHRRVRVVAGEEEVIARVAVVTAGAWVSSVLEDVSLPPMRVTREQVQHFVPVPSAGGSTTDWPSFIHHRDRFVYGLLSPGEGVKVAFHHDGPVVDPDRRTFDLDPLALADAAAYASSWLPGVEPTPVRGLTCLYTSTPTHDFVLARHGPVVVGSPCSGHGFKFTPLIGRILADLATDPS